MHYRKPEPSDRKAIHAVLNLSFDRAYAYFARRSFRGLRNAIAAEEGAEIAGVINYRVLTVKGKKAGYLYYLAVHPDHRKKGLGRGLIGEAVRAIRDEIGETDVYTAIDRDNHASSDLALHLGFRVVGQDEMKKRFGAGRLRLLLQMNLMPWEDLYVLTGSKV